MRAMHFLIFVAALSLFACGDRYPPCAPEGNGPGTIYGPTPSPLPGPGGPNEPPDWADAPPTYSKNEDGEVCTCGPYQIGCTTDPDGVPGDEYGEISTPPDVCGGNCSSGGAGNNADSSAPDMQSGGFSPTAFKFVSTIPDDGEGPAGGWQEAFVTLKFFRWVSIFPETWTCSFKVGMPLRTAIRGTISPAWAAPPAHPLRRKPHTMLSRSNTRLESFAEG